jgi:hypothetical protein
LLIADLLISLVFWHVDGLDGQVDIELFAQINRELGICFGLFAAELMIQMCGFDRIRKGAEAV